MKRTPCIWIPRIGIVIALLSGPAGGAGAAVPATMSFQGVLNGAGGSPLNGNHDLAFRLYDAQSGGTALWTETQTGVAVSKGEFSVILGSVVPLNLPFDNPYWLGVSVDGGTELAPRLPLASAPYSLSLRLPYAATLSDSGAGLRVTNSNGPAIDANSIVRVNHQPPAPAAEGAVSVWHDGTMRVQLGAVASQSNVLLAHPGGAFGGLSSSGPANQALILSLDGPGANYALIDTYNGGVGTKLFLQGGPGSPIVLDTGMSGDNAVKLPAGSVNPTEILGVPGIAQSFFPGRVDVVDMGQMTDVLSLTVTTTTPGYIVLQATSQVGLYGLSGAAGNAVAYQIDENVGGLLDASYGRVVGFNNVPNSDYFYLTASADRTYFKSAGTYTFRFEALKTGGAAGVAYMYSPVLRAVFYPVSYGSVATVADAAEAAGFDRAEARTSLGNGPAAGPVSASVVDLRDLELRAARAAAEAERANRALLEARAAELRSQAIVIPGSAVDRRSR